MIRFIYYTCYDITISSRKLIFTLLEFNSAKWHSVYTMYLPTVLVLDLIRTINLKKDPHNTRFTQHLPFR